MQFDESCVECKLSNLFEMAEIESGIIEAEQPKVQEVKRQWSVYEDGALAYQLQEEENVNHYSGNISRRRTVRSDLEVAKDTARSEALEAFREEHEIAERNRRIEEEDREKARQLQLQMLKEEQEKALQAKEHDAMLAKKLQREEKIRLEEERRRRMAEKQMKEDEQLARRLSHHNGTGGQHHPRKHKTKTDYVEDSMGAMKIDNAPNRRSNHSHTRSSSSPGIIQPQTVALDPVGPLDSDEESDAIAKAVHDEAFARQLQKEEVQRSRPRTLSEEQQKQLQHDEKIARKMQHEEVMLAKKKTYNKYMDRVSNEIADPAPMVHVSKEKKIAVHAAAKHGNGVTLTDINRRSDDRNSPRLQQRANDGNIVASIDPTYNPNYTSKDNTNVILTKKKSLNDATPPESPAGTVERERPHDASENFVAIQGTRRSSTKEKKRSSFFSKLKKK